MWVSFKDGVAEGLGQSVLWVPIFLLAYGALGAPTWNEIAQAAGRGYAAVVVNCVDH